jgi:hypothetical protein
VARKNNSTLARIGSVSLSRSGHIALFHRIQPMASSPAIILRQSLLAISYDRIRMPAMADPDSAREYLRASLPSGRRRRAR